MYRSPIRWPRERVRQRRGEARQGGAKQGGAGRLARARVRACVRACERASLATTRTSYGRVVSLHVFN
jgi:hypothetical protein